MNASADDRGFTMIEALVALAIGGFVIATVATVTGQWLRSWRAGLPLLARAETLTTALDRIAGDLAAARFAPAGSDGQGIIFKGEPGAVTFVRRALPVEPPGLEIVRLGPERDTGEVTLARSRATIPFGSFPTRPIDAVPVTLLRTPYAVRFAYADRDRRWQASWANDKRIPRFVRVEVIDRGTGKGVLAPMVVRVRSEAPVRCASADASGDLCDRLLGLDTGPPAPILGMQPVGRATQ